MKLESTTKRGFQAATAILIAEWLGWYFQLERGYWMTLTAMALTMQTWGESVKRAFERVSMTIIGGLVGTALYFFIPINDSAALVLILVFVFFAVYLLQIFYLASAFFLTCFVVFLFALLGDWTIAILLDRIMETVMGAAIALIVGRLFFPATTDVDTLFIDFWEKINASFRLIFQEQQSVDRPVSSQHLAAECQIIRKNALAIRYEFLFQRMSRHHFSLQLNQTMQCTQYVINLVDAYHWLVPYLSQQEKESLAAAVKTTRYNIEALIGQLKHKKPVAMLPVTRVTALINKAISEDPARFASLDSDALGFFNLMYFFSRLNTCLSEVHSTLGKASN